jgi:hypothetical protein
MTVKLMSGLDDTGKRDEDRERVILDSTRLKLWIRNNNYYGNFRQWHAIVWHGELPIWKILSYQLESIAGERNELGIKVKWQFTVEQARQKLVRHYEELTSNN